MPVHPIGDRLELVLWQITSELWGSTSGACVSPIKRVAEASIGIDVRDMGEGRHLDLPKQPLYGRSGELVCYVHLHMKYTTHSEVGASASTAPHPRLSLSHTHPLPRRWASTWRRPASRGRRGSASSAA